MGFGGDAKALLGYAMQETEGVLGVPVSSGSVQRAELGTATISHTSFTKTFAVMCMMWKWETDQGFNLSDWHLQVAGTSGFSAVVQMQSPIPRLTRPIVFEFVVGEGYLHKVVTYIRLHLVLITA